MKRVRGSSQEINLAARKLRLESTPSEDVLWQKLRNRQVSGAKFRRQYPIGQMICDFCCPEHRLVIEIDGAAHDSPQQAERDAARTAHLERYGYTVLRFRAGKVENELPSVIQRIRAELLYAMIPLTLSQNWERVASLSEPGEGPMPKRSIEAPARNHANPYLSASC